MALTPETSAALKDALNAVISECGDTPGYEDLVAKLQDAEAAIPELDGHDAPEHGGDHETPAEDAAPEHESADDMFAAAEAKHKDASKKKRAAGGHDNPFADKADA